MRKHDLVFANFILRFGPSAVLLDYASEVLIPAFSDETNVRTFGDTEFRFYNVKLSNVGSDNGIPVLALHGHFVKDMTLRRTQIFRPGRGLIEDEDEIESAPSAFFVLILNNHRLLYYGETPNTPELSAFSTTAQHFLRARYHTFIREQHDRANVTRLGVQRLTLKEIQRRIPPPVLTVVPVAGEDLISEIIDRFSKLTQIRFKLTEPNDEHDASAAIAAVEGALRPLRPARLEVIAADPKGMNKEAAKHAILDASEGHNTEFVVDGLDTDGLRMKVENTEFALRVPIDNPPENDLALLQLLVGTYDQLAAQNKVRKLPTPPNAAARLSQLSEDQ